MCWEMDYLFYAELEKANKAEKAQEQRAGVIKDLLNDANKQPENTKIEPALIKDVVPAK